MTAAISDQGLQIASAHITTYGVRAVDVFYVKDVFGLKVENERKLGALREAMVAALAPPGEGGGATCWRRGPPPIGRDLPGADLARCTGTSRSNAVADQPNMRPDQSRIRARITS